MADDNDDLTGLPEPPPGWRWVLTVDPRLTNREAVVLVPVNAPDPEVPEDSQELIDRTRQLTADLLASRARRTSGMTTSTNKPLPKAAPDEESP